MEKLLTVSIAAYNVEAYLDKTLQSLICGKDLLDRIEVLIINDASTDGTINIAESYAAKYPDTFTAVTKENGGHGSTLNYSIKRARGKYFRMLDGDDWYDTAQFEQFIENLEKTDADLVLTPYTRVYEADGHEENVNRYRLEYGMEYKLEHETYNLLDNLHAAELTVKTELLRDNNVHITEHCCYTDDALVSYALLFSETVIKFHDNVYRYRIGVAGQSVSDEGRIRHWEDGIRVVTDIIKNTSGYINAYDGEKRKFVYNILCNTLGLQYDTFLLMDKFDIIRQRINNFNRDMMNFNREFYDYANTHCWKKRLAEDIIVRIPKLCETEEKNFVVFGAGKSGEKAVRVLLKENVKVSAVTDNEKAKWGQEISGVPVISPESAASLDNVIFYIAVKGFSNEIYTQLKNMGVQDKNIFNLPVRMEN